MQKLIDSLTENKKVNIKGKDYYVKSKVLYTIEEDKSVYYFKYELSENLNMIIIPDDDLLYIGKVVNDLDWKRISENEIQYNGEIYHKTGGGHQIISKIEFGNEEEVEGKCIFEDYECLNHIISIGFLTEKNIRADLYAEIIQKEDIIF